MARWLSFRRPSGHDERGATAIVLALAMVLVVGATGLGLDTANTTLKRQNAQRGVDSAALAIANDCALGYSNCSPSANASTANYYVGQNAPGASVGTPVVPNAGGKVTVHASQTVPTSFLKVLGIDSADVDATATAVWGAHPLAGDPVLPLAIPYCLWNESKPGTTTSPIVLRTDLVGKVIDEISVLPLSTLITSVVNWLMPVSSSCKLPDGQDAAMLRGPVWLTGISSVLSGIFNWIPSSCKMHTDDLNALVGGVLSTAVEPSCIAKLGTSIKPGTTILLPIYVPANNLLNLGFQTHACLLSTCLTVPPKLGVHIIGYAPFKVGGWNFAGNSYADPSAPACSSITLLGIQLGLITLPNLSVGCTGLTGRFVRTTVSDPNFTYSPSGADFGNTQVRLTE